MYVRGAEEMEMTDAALTLTFSLGGELDVTRIGYGAMRLTGQPGNFGPYEDWEGGKALLRRAVELGINFIDTARAYGPGHNERLIAEALHPYSPGLVIGTKGGVDKPAASQIVVDASPATLRAQVESALTALRVDRIDLFQLHRVDPNVPIEESVGALAALRQEGKIRLIGLSNVDRVELDRALAVAPIASVQNRFNQAERGDEALVDYTAAQGIAFIPYGPLGAHPMKQGAPLAQGDEGSGISSAASALRWLLERSPNIVIIPGTTSIAHLEENLGALEQK
jgi:aryl-alcohol dehydrogenase-like predicted oxidoreductase